ncbi:phospholipid/cholesterol/gamma-HCH transport system ATP-binding protein [Nannocystis exedens]|uniref:Phospholipid/cholesterol/gamma-HCH transport system ATP-binding protein n=1 Tax=Nannocystis exedens TaxID=54 RepID=A0A1I2DLH4_9BACT|nr:ABC transporter ATP-binding protein [Nannocystis exedens]PCC69074.1 ABC transporter ATP-binding protein [Nannocystis exedens]SFE81299.1 phospholipid/cholesterol/gamma-HCH transport system ATP-binding protein [Nannocystis exedens]
MAEQQPAITLEKVCKSFGPNRVLHEVSLTLPAGKIMVMLGPSGTGKSVLLRCLVGLMKPDSGRIFIEGQDITGLDERRSAGREQMFALRRKFGMLFQDGALFDDMCVGDNVAFPLRQHAKLSEREIAARVAEDLERVGLKNAQRKMPAELSGGMRKRVAFARAIALRPKIVLCDEPSSGLDPVMSATLDELILDLHRTLGMTFVVISHDTAEARKIADYVGLLYKGELQAFGLKDEVLRSNQRAINQFFERSTEGPIQVL